MLQVALADCLFLDLSPFPASSFFAAAGVGTFTSKGSRSSTAIRSKSSRIASETEKPINSSAAVARNFVSMHARTPELAVTLRASLV